MGPRRSGPAGPGDAPPAAVLPPADLDEPADGGARFRTVDPGVACGAALRGRLHFGPQPGEPGAAPGPPGEPRRPPPGATAVPATRGLTPPPLREQTHVAPRGRAGEG